MAHSRGPAYDRILEVRPCTCPFLPHLYPNGADRLFDLRLCQQDGDDVVLLRLPGLGRPAGPSIWTYRPEERPRGGAA